MHVNWPRLAPALHAFARIKPGSGGIFALCLGCSITNLTSASDLSLNDYSDWYQVEVIVFSPINPVDVSETWPLPDKSYPADMVTISENSADDIKPQNLAQLTQLQTSDFLPENDAPVIENRQQEFMFEGRSLHNQSNNVVPRNPVAISSDDSTRIEELPADDLESYDYSQLDSLLYPQTMQAFQQLQADDQILGDIARSLRRSSRYRFLSHLAWRQPVRATDEPTTILVQAGDHFDDEFLIDGTITLRRSRYLHIDTDLWFTRFTPGYDGASAPTPQVNMDEDTIENYPEIAKWEQLRHQQIPVQSYPLQQSRRMRSSTLHYIDHPMFGVLIQINRFEGEADPGTDLLSVIGNTFK